MLSTAYAARMFRPWYQDPGIHGTQNLVRQGDTNNPTEAAVPNGACIVHTTETLGPYPLQSLQDNTDLQRSDITDGKAGISLELTLQLVDYDNQCTTLSGAEVCIWHCDAQGQYPDDMTLARTCPGAGYLRGVQFTGYTGTVTFKTILPGSDLPELAPIQVHIILPCAVPSSRTVPTATVQLHFPPDAGTALHHTMPPSHTAGQLRRRDAGRETLTLSGDATTGYFASMVIGVSSTQKRAHGWGLPGAIPLY